MSLAATFRLSHVSIRLKLVTYTWRLCYKQSLHWLSALIKFTFQRILCVLCCQQWMLKKWRNSSVITLIYSKTHDYWSDWSVNHQGSIMQKDSRLIKTSAPSVSQINAEYVTQVSYNHFIMRNTVLLFVFICSQCVCLYSLSSSRTNTGLLMSRTNYPSTLRWEENL